MSEENAQAGTPEVPASGIDAPIPNQGESSSPDATDDMPWLLRDKFKGESTEEQIRNQAMAYPELQNKMGKWWGAPKDSDYDVAALEEYGIGAEDPILTGMKTTFKEMGLSNEAVKKLAASYDDSMKSMARQMEEKLQKSMTPDFAASAKRVEGWMGKFSKDEQDVMKGWLQTPEDFKVFDTLRALNPSGNANNIPTQGANYGHKYETSKQVEQEKQDNFAKYKKGGSYRDEIAQRMRDALMREKQR